MIPKGRFSKGRLKHIWLQTITETCDIISILQIRNKISKPIVSKTSVRASHYNHRRSIFRDKTFNFHLHFVKAILSSFNNNGSCLWNRILWFLHLLSINYVFCVPLYKFRLNKNLCIHCLSICSVICHPTNVINVEVREDACLLLFLTIF